MTTKTRKPGVRTPEGEARRIAAITGDNNPAKRPEVRAAIADAKNGVAREAFDAEWLANMSAAHMGELNGMYGKTHSEDTKALQRAAASNKAWVNDGTTSRRIDLTDVDAMIAEGWVRGRLVTKSGPRGPYKKKAMSL